MRGANFTSFPSSPTTVKLADDIQAKRSRSDRSTRASVAFRPTLAMDSQIFVTNLLHISERFAKVCLNYHTSNLMLVVACDEANEKAGVAFNKVERMMISHIGLSAALFVTALSVSDANARLFGASLPSLTDASHEALHKPTGCQAQVVLRGQLFIKAQITDPDCLPKGVKARDIPGTLFDFQVTP